MKTKEEIENKINQLKSENKELQKELQKEMDNLEPGWQSLNTGKIDLMITANLNNIIILNWVLGKEETFEPFTLYEKKV